MSRGCRRYEMSAHIMSNSGEKFPLLYQCQIKIQIAFKKRKEMI